MRETQKQIVSASGEGAAPLPAPPEEVEAEARTGLRVTATWVIGGAVAILLLASQLFVTSSFFSLGSLSSLTPLVGVMIIVATGQAFVISTGGIDLSVPATMTLMGAVILKQSEGQSANLAGALVFCFVACVVIGLINGVLVEGLRLSSLVVTLAVGQLVTGYTELYRSTGIQKVPPNISKWASADIFGGVSYILVISVVFAILMTLFLHRFVLGRRLVASSAAVQAATLSGLRARGYRVFAYVIAAVAYGIGGVLASGQIGTPDLTLGEPYLLTSIVAVVLGGAALIGGRVSPIATLLGAIFIVVLNFDLQVKGLSDGWRMVVQGGVLIAGLSLIFVLRQSTAVRSVLASFGKAAPSRPRVTN
jgi:ribose transport system permease protein